MKYTGRFVSLVHVVTFGSILAIYGFIKSGNTFSESQLLFDASLTMVELVIAYLLGKQYDKVKFYAEMDILTEVYNRRYAIELFPKLVNLSERRLEKLSILMVDANQLKFINDTYGHQLGDAVIWHVSNVLLENTRKTDVVARFGGDEFLVIAPFADRDMAVEIAHRISEALVAESTEFPVPVTAAIGVATYPDDGRTLDALLHAADMRMYHNKRTRRQKA